MINRSGLSILEVLLSTALVGVVAAGFFSFNGFQLDIASKLNRRGNLFDDLFILTKTLENSTVCRDVFSSVDLTDNVAIYTGDYTYTSTDGHKIKLPLGDEKYILSSRIIRNPDQETYAELRIALSEVDPNKTKELNIPLYVETATNGKITRCATRPLLNLSPGGCP